MNKQVGLDYDVLVKSLKKEEKAIEDKVAVDKIRHRMRKIAFDVYSVDNDPYDGLWKLESNAEDGKEYLIRMDNNVSIEAKTGGWSATSNETGTNITLAYRGFPMQKLSGKLFGFDKNDVSIFKKALLEKVASDDKFKKMIFNMQTDETKSQLIKVFPELAVQK